MKKSWIIVPLIFVAIGVGMWYAMPIQNTSEVNTAPIIGDNLALGTDGNDELGAYLIGYTGMTVYTTSKDTGSTSTCYDTCATNWPPYIVSPSDNIQQLKAGVNGTVGTTVRTDGSLQLTYNGKPLYFYIGDETGSDTKGHGLGGVWSVVTP